MGASGAVRAGGAYVEIFAKDGQFQQAMTRTANKLKAVGASMRTFGAGLMGMGTAIVSPILASAQAFANVGSALYDMSTRTGVATEALSVLQFAAEQTGTDMAGVETAVKKMQKAIFSASTGGKEAAEALAMVGLSAQDLAGLSADEQMGKIADGLMAIQDPGTRAAVAMAIFGKAGTSILPMLEGGSAGMAAFAAEAQRLGLVMDGDTAAKADALGDSIDALKASMRMAFIQIGSAVAPILTQVAQSLAKTAAAVGNFIRENQTLVTNALKIGLAFIVFGGAVYGIGTAIGVASRAIIFLRGVLQILPALFTPVGLAATAAFAAVAAGVVVARTLSSAFKRETDAIMAALMRLDFSSAWEIMNINFAIALTQMAAKAANILGNIQGFFAATGAFVGDKLIEGLDRFMGLFGADIITLQNAWERLGIYFRAAFDWKWAITGMNAAIDAADRKAEEARAKAPTADARAADRAAGRQAAADARQASMDATAQGFADTVEVLREDLDRVHQRMIPKEAEGASAPVVPGRMDLGEAAAAAARSGVGQTLGTFGSMEGMGIGPELNDATKQTAENTASAADSLKQIAAAVAPQQRAGGGVAAVVAAPRAQAMANAASAGTAAADFSAVVGRLETGFQAVVNAITAHAQLTAKGNAALNAIAKGITSVGAAFT